MHLLVIGDTRYREPRRFGPFAKPGAGVVWIRSGQGQLRIGDATWTLKPGAHFWFYGAQQPRIVSPAPGGTMTTRSIWFAGPGLDGWLEELDVGHQPYLRLPHPHRVYRAYRSLRQLARRQPPNWEWQVHVILNAVLRDFLLTRNLLARDRQSLPEAIRRVLDAIALDPVRDWKASELAALAGMSCSGFRSRFRETLKKAPHEYLQQARLDLARELLADPKTRIKEIARKLHFSSDHYFSNVFHQHTGFSPTDFRQHLGLDEHSGSSGRPAVSSPCEPRRPGRRRA